MRAEYQNPVSPQQSNPFEAPAMASKSTGGSRTSLLQRLQDQKALIFGGLAFCCLAGLVVTGKWALDHFGCACLEPIEPGKEPEVFLKPEPDPMFGVAFTSMTGD